MKQANGQRDELLHCLIHPNHRPEAQAYQSSYSALTMGAGQQE